MRASISLLFLLSGALTSSSAWAEKPTPLSRFGAVLGANYDLGTLSNSGLNQPGRTMNALSLEGLGGYWIGRCLLGADLDYRWEGQLSGLDQSGGTNLKGHGWLLGVGGKFQVSPIWAIQGAVDFLGKYTFAKQTSGSEDDNLNSPIVLRVKAQYFPFREKPLSFDLDFQYLSYANWEVTSVTYSNSTNGFLVGAGLSWHFGAPAAATAAVPAPSPEAAKAVPIENVPPADTLQSQLEKLVTVKKLPAGLMVNVEGNTSFPSSSADLLPTAQANLKKIASLLAADKNARIRIVCHSDASGSKAKNQALSEKRAETVRALFLENGFSGVRVRASGAGDTQPLVSNKTKEGRDQNRRVEIFVN